jgi:hypothetical protein
MGHAKDNGWFLNFYFWLKGVIGDGPRKINSNNKLNLIFKYLKTWLNKN